MREDWNKCPFESCLEAVPKTKKIPTSSYLAVGSFPIVSQEDGKISGYWNEYQDVLHISHPVIVFGDHTRVLKYIDFDFVIGADGVKVLSPKSYLIPKFLYHYLCWCKIPSLGYSRHYKLLKELSVPVPAIEEQERIVAELDLLTGIIDKQKAQLKELDTLAQSIFYDMFGDPLENEKGWGAKQLNSVIQVKGRVGWKGYKKEDLRDSGPLAIGGGHITDFGEIDLSNPVFLSQEKYEESPEIMIETGDLILVQRGTIGKVGLIRSDIGQATINPCVLILRPYSINNVYTLHYFLSKSMQEYLKKLVRGVAQPMITQQQVNSIAIPVPPLSLQQSFAQKIQSIESQKASINRSIAETRKLFDYTMDKYFG